VVGRFPVAHATKAEWQQTQETLRAEVRRVTALLRSVRDPEAHAVGQWNLAEVALHLSQAWMVVPGLARQDLSRVHDVMPVAPGGSLIRDMGELGEVTIRGVCNDPERDPAVLAARIEAAAEEYFSECAGHSAEEQRPWMVEGVSLSLSTLTGHLLNETVMHGYDIARADGRRWRIEPAAAAMVLSRFIIPLLRRLDAREMVDGDQAAGLRATYELRIRGSDWFYFVFENGALSIEAPSSRRVDCHISADPVALLLVIWARQNQWKAIAKGQLLAWGRKPWLGPRFRTVMRNP
jgi:SCP-2 sterol transfer family